MSHLVQILLLFAVLSGPSRAVAVPDQGPLLEDGVFLARVQGTLEPPAAGRGWTFRVHGMLEGQRDRRIDLLPSATLEDMKRRLESLAPGTTANFEISARVTTYHGRNSALPMFAATIAEFAASAGSTALRPPGAAIAELAVEDDSDDDLPAVRRAEDPSEAFGIRWVPLLPQARAARERALVQGGPVQADEVERDLLDRIGLVQRSSDLAPQDRQSEARQLAIQMTGGAVDPLTQRPWLEPARPVQDRHGIVTRDPITGEWRFIFESSRGEIGEREATLLPCAVLERLERQARSAQEPLSVVMSGQVTRFEGRAYLLPTVVSQVRTGRALGR
ncbi:MAG: hypothetical protein ACOYMI_07905 [Phycisphaerales bacterium]